MFSLKTMGGMLMNGTIDTSPMYQGSVRSLEERILISKMCHARIGAIVKGLSICEVKGLQPFTTDPGFASVLQLLDQKFNDFVKQYQLELEYEEKQTEMEELRLLKRLDDFAFTEYIDAKALEGMSVKQILGTRTKAWGEFSEKRSEIVSKLKKITLESPDDIKFRSALDKLLKEFKKDAGDYEHETSKLKLKTSLEIGAGISGAGSLALIQRFVSAPSLDVLLLLGAPIALGYLAKAVPQLLDVMRRKEKLKDLEGYTLFGPYKKFL